MSWGCSRKRSPSHLPVSQMYNLFAKSASNAVDDISWGTGKMISDLYGSLVTRHFLIVANERTCQCWENVRTQAIHQDHWSFHLHLSQCHLLHNLHSLQKVIHRWNSEITRPPIPKTTLWHRERSQKASKPVMRHCNLPNHSKPYMAVCTLSLHQGSTESGTTIEQNIFFKLALLILWYQQTLFIQQIYSVVFHVTRHQPIA